MQEIVISRLLSLQTWADAIAKFTNIKEDQDMPKIVSDGKLLERDFMFHENATENVPAYQRMKQQDPWSFTSENASTKY